MKADICFSANVPEYSNGGGQLLRGHGLLFLSRPLTATKIYAKSLLFKGITTKNVLESPWLRSPFPCRDAVWSSKRSQDQEEGDILHLSLALDTPRIAQVHLISSSFGFLIHQKVY